MLKRCCNDPALRWGRTYKTNYFCAGCRNIPERYWGEGISRRLFKRWQEKQSAGTVGTCTGPTPPDTPPPKRQRRPSGEGLRHLESSQPTTESQRRGGRAAGPSDHKVSGDGIQLGASMNDVMMYVIKRLATKCQRAHLLI